MQAIAVANQKGGAGKTTTAVHLAAGLARRGRSVLLVDLDPQATATHWLGVEPRDKGLSRALNYSGGLDSLAVQTHVGGLSLVPGDRVLAAAADSGFRNSPVPQAQLAQALESTGPQWDLAVIDPPPTLSRLMVNALVAAEGGVVVPVPAGAMELMHLQDLEDTIASVDRSRLTDGLAVLAVVMVKTRNTRLDQDVYERLEQLYDDTLCATTIRYSVRVQEAFDRGVTVEEHAPDHPVTQDFTSFIDELAERIEP